MRKHGNEAGPDVSRRMTYRVQWLVMHPSNSSPNLVLEAMEESSEADAPLDEQLEYDGSNCVRDRVELTSLTLL